MGPPAHGTFGCRRGRRRKVPRRGPADGYRQEQRDGDRPASRFSLHAARAGPKGRTGPDVPEQGCRPRSRRAAGVAMSQGNVELHHRAHDAFNRRDLAAMLALTDPAVTFTPYEVSVQGGDPYRGHDGVRSWWEESFAVLPDLRVETFEVRDLGNMTFVHGRLSGRGAGSGAPIERTLWQVV